MDADCIEIDDLFALGAERVEVVGDAILVLGDCLGMAACIPCDHVISDPPYEQVMHDAAGKINRIRADGQTTADEIPFEGIDLIRPDVSKACVTASAGWVILFTLAEGVRAWRDDIQAAGGKWDTVCFWIKPDSTPRMNGQGPARGAECFVTAWAGTGYRSWNAGGKRGVYVHLVNAKGRVAAKDGGHPTEKPVALMADIVLDFTKPGQLVLDPFMGSGTTGVACLKHGRRFIGIEKDPVWFEVALKRLRAEHETPKLFEPFVKAQRQERLWATEDLPRQKRPAKAKSVEVLPAGLAGEVAPTGEHLVAHLAEGGEDASPSDGPVPGVVAAADDVEHGVEGDEDQLLAVA